MSALSPELNEPFLLIDDESDFLDSMSLLLAPLGYEVVTSTGGADALRKIAEYKPFLVVSDFRMPELDGLEVCQAARNAGYENAFCLFTGYADKNLAIQSLQAGVNEILEKPIVTEQLRGIVRKYAERRLDRIRQVKSNQDRVASVFAEEASEALSDIEHLFLRLEQDSVDTVVADLMIRKVHTVARGASQIHGASALHELATRFENALQRVKSESWQLDEIALDLFLETADLCRSFVSSIASREMFDPDVVSRAAKASQALQILNSSSSLDQAVEQLPGQLINGAAVETETDGVFVSSDKLDSFMKLSGEMVVLKNGFAMAIRDPESRTDGERFEKKLADFFQAFNKVTDNLQEQIMSVRKVKLDRALSRLPRLVRQTSRDVGKKVMFDTKGFELGVDKSIAKALSSTLAHMIRNAIDHGIEEPTRRIELGKIAEGRVTIAVQEIQGCIEVSVSDDGSGIDRERVLAKAIEKGLVDAGRAAQMSAHEINELIFAPGLTTAERVSPLSGRGVGMDVVRSAILALHGRIGIESKKGEGTRFILTIPIPKTVMVEQTVIARSRGSLIAVPLQSISRIVPSEELKTVKMGSTWAFQHDDKTVRLIDHRCLASDMKQLPLSVEPKGSVIVMRNKSHYVGMLVDAIYDQLEAVVRPFDSIVQSLPGFRGTTVLGDDKIAYVISPTEVISIALGVSEEAS